LNGTLFDVRVAGVPHRRMMQEEFKHGYFFDVNAGPNKTNFSAAGRNHFVEDNAGAMKIGTGQSNAPTQ
jgi:hypothetical protein